MFAIEDEEWPGISKLIEEAGEVQQVCGKLLGTHGQVEHWDGSNLRVELQKELADLLAAIHFVQDFCDLDQEFIAARMDAKLARFARWHELGETNFKSLPDQ